MSTLVKGTLILTLATMISKILGFIYVVPFTALVGTQGYILFEYAYKPYVIILSFATLGVPLAVSKFISKYNELGDYQTGQRLFKSGLLFLTLTGTICFFILFFFAPSIASLLVSKNDTTGNSIEDVIFVIRMVSFALIIVPPMAIVRGFFQGNHSMEPTAISQVVEQLIRILFILVGSYLAIHIFKQSTSFAVGLATFAAFIGAIGGCYVLYKYWSKRKDSMKEQVKNSSVTTTVSLPAMYNELLSYAIPFVIVGLAIPIYQTIDTFTINSAMMKTGVNQLEAETVNSVVALVQKIIMIPVSLATALGLTLVPTITKSYVAKEFDVLKSHISKTFLIIFYLTLPCVVLLMSLSQPSFSFLFGIKHEVLGGELMLWYAPMAIVLSIFIVTSSILQGMDRHKFVIISLFAGLIFKALTNHLFVVSFGGIGSAISTDIGFLLSIALNVYAIKKYCQFHFSSIYGVTGKIIGLTLMTGMIVFGVDCAIQSTIGNLVEANFLQTGIRLMIGGLLGSFIYIVSSYHMNIMQPVLGEAMANKLRHPCKTLYGYLSVIKNKL